MEINNNIQNNQIHYLNANQALNRIATGIKLNSASDDASALSIVQNLQIQSSGISQSIDNVNSGLAALQISDGALTSQSEILDEVKQKLLQASTDTTSQEGRESLLNDIQGLLENFNNIASNTNYNGESLLQNSSTDNSESSSFQIQAGQNSDSLIDTPAIQSNTTGVGLDGLLNQDPATFTSQTARDFLENLDNAIDNVSSFRSDIGSVQNQLQSTSRNLISEFTQTSASSSIIQDIDYAQEVSNFSKQNILAQIGAYGAAQSKNINQAMVTRLLS
ncbi:flagellin [Arcobacter arenosus]|uniref:Flagellin n=1 Tax=Arcobacter arenosus TaxID=2576037 RepID=A0A5R8XY66_9BACT|nr:flagellin [Arcobacter arenosus]TLP36201.1 flagellin [Arcobacter arenosus]